MVNAGTGTGNTDNVTALTVANAGIYANGGAIINNGLQVNGGSILNGGAVVNNGFTANGGSTVNGSTKLNGNVTVEGPVNGGAPVTISMGGNVVQDVAAPVFGTDAANKAYVDAGFNALRQEDRRLQSGIAMAAAIPHTVGLPGERVAFGVDWGNYAGANAVGFDGALRLGELKFAGGPVSVQGNAGFAASGDGAGRIDTKAGVRFGF
ncbi:MAG: hypothetical protein WBX25_14480 [Rhodomicrobium sp.]